MARMTAAAVADMVGGQLFIPLSSDAKTDCNVGEGPVITCIKSLGEAGESDVSFFAPTSRKQYRELFSLACSSNAGAILVKRSFNEFPQVQIVVDNPMEAVVRLSSIFFDAQHVREGISPKSEIHETANIASSAKISPYCVVGRNVSIGDNTVLHPHVVVYDGVQIGANCTLHAHVVIREHVKVEDDCVFQPGVVVGGDGFGYFYKKGVGHQRIPHIGAVVVESGVDFGSNTTIDRGMLGDTRIGAGTKIDNLVMIGHNVRIGRETILCGQVGISGSTTVGDNVILAGKVGVADHVKIGSNVRASAMTGIGSDVPEATDVSGYPAVPSAEWRRTVASLKRLNTLVRGRLSGVAEEKHEVDD